MNYSLKSDIKIVDSTGEIGKITLIGSNVLEVIQNMYSQLTALSEFNTWKEFQLSKEIDELKNELAQLKLRL
ncbi:hypothetical protein [Microbacter margulisiae]|uniref:Uncharacterized protein n=1 Tax=Microbacter margulisiae TaxID=1350067 RepID=A0A7W5DNA9_9PORP|nr:hypothetical protein [Microbacter margulisiae]MBB3185911.1 hypothetical protein [Microbacter margulisiae]